MEFFSQQIKNERTILKNSIENISMIYELNDEDQYKAEFLLNSEDIIIKLLHYIEFWREKSVSVKNLISLLNLLTSFFKFLDNELLNHMQVKQYK